MPSQDALARADREPEPARLLLLEPDDVERLSVHRLLERAAPGAAVESVSSWWQARPVVHRGAPDVMLVSSDMEQPGSELGERLQAASTEIVLVLRTADPERLRRLLRLPVAAVLREVDLSVPSLRQLLGALGPESAAVSRTASEHQPGRQAPARRAVPRGMQPALTQRELDTLALLVEGLSNRQIARELGISEHGAKRHVSNVRAKLNCHNRTMAVTTAIRLGLVAAEPR
jgi:DNA-binding NarL/FixJ family response regulator